MPSLLVSELGVHHVEGPRLLVGLPQAIREVVRREHIAETVRAPVEGVSSRRRGALLVAPALGRAAPAGHVVDGRNPLADAAAPEASLAITFSYQLESVCATSKGSRHRTCHSSSRTEVHRVPVCRPKILMNG